MAVVSAATFTVKPDRFEERWEKSARPRRSLRSAVRRCAIAGRPRGGEATGSLAFIFEADDFGAYGAAMDKFMADPEGMALLSAVNTTAGPVAGFQGTLWVDVPL